MTQQPRPSKRTSNTHLHLRVSNEDKHVIQEAAQNMGMTVSEFVLLAALDAVEKVPYPPEPEPTPEAADEPVPPSFRQICETATRGGAYGYARVGFELAARVRHWIPEQISDEDWEAAWWNLLSYLQDGNEYGVLDWFRKHYPKCMSLVPRRRWLQFARGAIAAYRHDRVQ